MSRDSPPDSPDWLTLHCPFCSVKLRIKTAYAHLRGRCPGCGLRIEPIRPAPPQAERAVSDADEPVGLAPAEDEWPEPPIMEDEVGPSYDMNKAPVQWEPQKPDVAGSEDVFAVELESVPNRPATPERTSAYSPPAPMSPQELPVLYQLSEAELHPIRPPKPPRRPFWDGIYSFPWRFQNLKPLLYLTLGFDVWAFFAMALIALGGFVGAAGGPLDVRMVAAGIVGLVLAITWITIWVGSYGAAHFLAIVQDTAAGNDAVTWPEGTWKEWFWKFAYLVWLYGCWVGIAWGGVWFLDFFVAIPLFIKCIVVLTPALILFPISLLSTMAADAPWVVIHFRLLGRFFERPWAGVAMYLHSVVLAIPCFLLGFEVIVRGQYFLIPILGLVWSASLLAYGRVLGRVGWYLTNEEGREKSGRRRPRKRPAPTATV